MINFNFPTGIYLCGVSIPAEDIVVSSYVLVETCQFVLKNVTHSIAFGFDKC